MNQEQFWVTGWGDRWAYGTGVAGTVTAPAAGPGGAAGTTGAMGATVGGPWGAAGGTQSGVLSPRNQIRELFGAAQVLAYQGKEEGCQYVLAELTTTYDQFTSQLREAGVDPAEVTSWRQEQIALARPVTEVQGMTRFTVDDITGTDVRNLQDENLGSISDVLVDPNSGQISYAIVARGGFLGIGEDHVAVPWNQFRATPGLNTLVLDMSEEALESAPTVDPDTFADPATVTEQDQQVDQYWSQVRGG